jgi:hypothetical protein
VLLFGPYVEIVETFLPDGSGVGVGKPTHRKERECVEHPAYFQCAKSQGEFVPLFVEWTISSDERSRNLPLVVQLLLRRRIGLGFKEGVCIAAVLWTVDSTSEFILSRVKANT